MLLAAEVKSKQVAEEAAKKLKKEPSTEKPSDKVEVPKDDGKKKLKKTKSDISDVPPVEAKPTSEAVQQQTPVEAGKDDGKKKLKKTKSDISEAPEVKPTEASKEPETKQPAEPAEKALTALEKQKAEKLKLEGGL
jgi:hypothetical protein